MDQTVNLNQSYCLQSIHNFGSTTIQNVCSGKTYEVPWGAADWVGFLAILGICCFVGMLLCGLVAMMWSDFWRHK